MSTIVFPRGVPDIRPQYIIGLENKVDVQPGITTIANGAEQSLGSIALPSDGFVQTFQRMRAFWIGRWTGIGNKTFRVSIDSAITVFNLLILNNTDPDDWMFEVLFVNLNTSDVPNGSAIVFTRFTQNINENGAAPANIAEWGSAVRILPGTGFGFNKNVNQVHSAELFVTKATPADVVSSYCSWCTVM